MMNNQQNEPASKSLIYVQDDRVTVTTGQMQTVFRRGASERQTAENAARQIALVQAIVAEADPDIRRGLIVPGDWSLARLRDELAAEEGRRFAATAQPGGLLRGVLMGLIAGVAALLLIWLLS